MDGNPRVASDVAGFRRLSASWNIQVQSAGEVCHAGDMGATKPLRGEYTEVAFRDKSSEVFERIWQETPL